MKKDSDNFEANAIEHKADNDDNWFHNELHFVMVFKQEGSNDKQKGVHIGHEGSFVGDSHDNRVHCEEKHYGNQMLKRY